MLVARSGDRSPAGHPAKPETITQVLVAGTVALCCVAPLLTSLSRSGQAPPEAYLIFERLFFFNDYVGSLAMLVALVLALAVPKMQDAVIRLAAWAGDHPVSVVGATFVALALCSRFVYLAHPLSMDEYAPWLQANAFAQGSIYAHFPPGLLDELVPRQFQNVFVAVDRQTGAAVSTYWPGLALVTAPFAALGIGWCVNPAFGALALAMIYKLASESTGCRAAGGWAMLAALASPQFTISAISFYAMPGELALNLLFVWLLLQPRLATSFAAGLIGGLALAMHNPVPHALFAAPCIAWLALDRQRWPRLLAVLTGYLPLVVVLGWGWARVMAGVQIAPRSGGPSIDHSIVSRALAFAGRMFALPDADMITARWYATWKTWIWACPGLLVLVFLPRVRGIRERLLIAGLAVTYCFYFFVRPDQGHGWGYRYVHAAWAALPVAGGLWIAGTTDAGRRWAAAIVAAGLLATPAFLWQTHQTVAEALSWRISPPGPGDWVVFVAENTGRYRGDLVQNPPGQSRLLYLASHGPSADGGLMAREFPGAARVGSDRRGSLWRVPDGAVTRKLQATPADAGPR